MHLAGHGQGEVVDEADVAWDLLLGNAALAVSAHLRLFGCLPRPQLDPAAQLFAVARVRYAEHLRRFHLGMAEQELLDLSRIDILTPADNQIVDAADASRA